MIRLVLLFILLQLAITSQPIKLITCGGTIDSYQIDQNQTYIFKESYIPTMIEQSRCLAPITFQHLMSKDSLLMTDQDRRTILSACQATQEDKIIITHGTDTMTQTAKFIGQHQQSLKKTVVLLGAMVPYNQPNSDALFNLGFAVSSVQLLAPGVYIAMNGLIFNWYNVRKNKQKSIFEVIESDTSSNQL